MAEMPRYPQDGRAELLLEFGRLTLRSERTGGVHTISLAGELDLATSGTAQAELERVEATDAARIVLDLSGLTFMDSTGVRLVMAANARSRADADRLALVRGPHAVQRVFELCGVVDLLPFAE
jgi:stage II sporulation protein AA (anti-sigma F factor antagonist)